MISTSDALRLVVLRELLDGKERALEAIAASCGLHPVHVAVLVAELHQAGMVAYRHQHRESNPLLPITFAQILYEGAVWATHPTRVSGVG